MRQCRGARIERSLAYLWPMTEALFDSTVDLAAAVRFAAPATF
jgi:hypothetical protein